MIYVAISGNLYASFINCRRRMDWLVCIHITLGYYNLGILYKSISVNVNPKLSLIVYLVMGWVGIIFLPIIIMRTSWLFILFIVLGGLSYTIGAWFYAQKPSILSYDLAYFYRNRFNVSFNSNTLFYLENLK